MTTTQNSFCQEDKIYCFQAFDKDVGLGSPVFYTFNGSGDEYKYFELNRNTGQIYIMTQIPDNEFTRPVTLVVRATQYDNKDRYTVTTLTLTKGGIFDSDLQFLQRDYQVKILENAPLNTPVTTLLTNKPLDRRVHFVVDKVMNTAARLLTIYLTLFHEPVQIICSIICIISCYLLLLHFLC